MLTKDKSIAERHVETDRYILSTLPMLYIPCRKDWGASGDSFLSSDGHGYPCVVTGAVRTGEGVSFDKIDDVITIADTALDNIATFTYGAWVYPISDGEGDYGQILCKGNKEFRIYLGNYIDGKVVAATTPAESVSTTKLTLNAWSHAMTTYDNVGDWKIRLYINGVGVIYDTQTAADGTITSDVGVSFTIGNSTATDRTWDGKIGELRIYPRVLNPIEICRDYQMTRWRFR